MESAEANAMKLADTVNVAPTDFLNDLNSSTSSAMSGLTTGNWGSHTSSITFDGGTSLSLKKVLLWGGVAVLGFLVWRKIRKVGK